MKKYRNQYSEECLVLLAASADFKSLLTGLKIPKRGWVADPDWIPRRVRPRHSASLAGLWWGEYTSPGITLPEQAVWMVLRVNRLDGFIENAEYVVFRQGYVLRHGSLSEMAAYIQQRLGFQVSVLGGENRAVSSYVPVMAPASGTALSANWGMAVAGPGAKAIVEQRGIAVGWQRGDVLAGDDGTAVVTEEGTARAGRSGLAVGKSYSTACSGNSGVSLTAAKGKSFSGAAGVSHTGYDGCASSGPGGIISIRYRENGRDRLAVGYIGENGLEPDVLYKLDENHQFVKV